MAHLGRSQVFEEAEITYFASLWKTEVIHSIASPKDNHEALA